MKQAKYKMHSIRTHPKDLILTLSSKPEFF